jgi:translation initiation factor 2A
MFKGGKPSQRYIPGAPIPGAPAGSGAGEGNKKKKNKKKGSKEEDEAATPPVEEMAKVAIDTPSPVAASGDDAAAKKIRNVEKKVCPFCSLTCDES